MTQTGEAVGWGPIIGAAIATFVALPMAGGLLINVVFGYPVTVVGGPMEMVRMVTALSVFSFFVAWIPLLIAIPLVKKLSKNGPPPLIYLILFGLAAGTVFNFIFEVPASRDGPAVLVLAGIYAVVYSLLLRIFHRWALDQKAKNTA